MIIYSFGGKKGRTFRLKEHKDLIAIRTQLPIPWETLPFATATRRALTGAPSVARFAAAGVSVLKVGASKRDAVRATLKRDPALRFAGRVLCDPASKAPVIYTENLFVKFDDDVSARTCRALLKDNNLHTKRMLEYARNAYFVGAPDDCGQDVFEIAQALLAHDAVELCHPELVRSIRSRAAFPQQWHLKKTAINGATVDAHANVEAAWALSQGEGITLAVIDDGVDIDHKEFTRSGKVIAPWDVTHKRPDPRPTARDNHGTACAGVACADGLHGASGVAPKTRLIPIRLASGLGSQAEADAFIWAAKNGADVISCSWGPEDGAWWDPRDPLHKQVVPLPDSTRLAIDWAVQNGRGGKGCVITFAAGNGNESVDNDGYASNPKVIAVAACNDSAKRSAYSDFGKAVWCAFPSNDGEPAKTPGIWTTDRRGTAGYNPGKAEAGDAEGNYTNAFGGTSSACPGVAGVAALVLARNPALRHDEVRDILKRACDRIDTASGKYDTTGRSPYYGYGRINAATAVSLAVPAALSYIAIHTAVQDVAIEDLKTTRLAVAVGDTQPIKGIKVTVDIEHTYIGDLVVRLVPPAAAGITPIVLHDRAGRGAQNLKTEFTVANAPGLASLLGKVPQGTWLLEVQDTSKDDTGRLRRFGVELAY